MNFSLSKLVVAAAMVLPLVSIAAIPGNGMLNTRHDFASRTMFLASQTTSGTAGAANSVGLCSYCHTPHAAQTTALLWNRAPATQSYSWDAGGQTTAGGTNYAAIAPAYRGPSVKCLSCHDGSVTIGDVGAYMEGTHLGDANTLNTYKVGANDAAGDLPKTVGVGGKLTGTHPIGMPYPFNNVGSKYNGIDTGATVNTNEFVAAPTVSAKLVSGVKLYKDDAVNITAGGAAGVAGIECSSCHDVHNQSTSEDLFLRGKLAGSTKADGYICLQCHIK